jgi:predicted NBD/HSP70 family sugar kinase
MSICEVGMGKDLTYAMNPLLNIDKEGKQVFSLLQKKGPLTKNDLLNLIHSNFTSLNRIMQPLEERKLIIEVGIGDSSGGRKPILYDINPKSFYILGIDISRPYTQVIVTGPKMNILDKTRFSMDESHTPAKTVAAIATIFTEIREKLALAKERFLGIGLSTVGPLDRINGSMTHPINFPAPGWVGAPIRSMVAEVCGLPVFLDTGANTAILAEYLFGLGRGYPNIAYFNCSTGIRTGGISAGTIVRTINDAEDAFGHMVVDVDGDACHCGKYGCIECYSSIYAILRKYIAAIKQGRPSGISKPVEEIDYTDIAQAAEDGEPLAVEIITHAATIFGVGLANFINLLNPGLVILSGPLISVSNMYYRVSTETASRRLYPKDASRIIFSKSGNFGEDAISLGAAVMVIEYYLS